MTPANWNALETVTNTVRPGLGEKKLVHPSTGLCGMTADFGDPWVLVETFGSVRHQVREQGQL